MIELDKLSSLPIDEIPSGYMQDGMFVIPGLSVMVTTQCNLHCKLCSQKTSYIKAKSFSLSRIKLWIDEVFKMADYVVKLGLGGGEPLMNQELADILLYLENYRDRIGSLRIVTNATIVPDKKILNASTAANCNYLLDDYPVENKLSEIIAELEKYNIKYSVRDYRSVTPYMGGWVDYGDFKTRQDEASEDACPRKGLYIDLCDGKLFVCGIERVFMEIAEPSIIDACRSDYIDLESHGGTACEKRDQLMNIWKKDRLVSCDYCNGRNVDSPRFPPGEQLTPEELAEIKKVEI